MFREKIKIDKFKGRNNFGLWSIKTEALLTVQGLVETLKGGQVTRNNDKSHANEEGKKYNPVKFIG